MCLWTLWLHNALPTASPWQQMQFSPVLITDVHLTSQYIIQNSSCNVTTFFSQGIRGRDYVNVFLSTKPLKTWLTVSNRVVPGWKCFEVAFRKSQALQEMVGRKKKSSEVGDDCRSSISASWCPAHFTGPYSALLYQFNKKLSE